MHWTLSLVGILVVLDVAHADLVTAEVEVVDSWPGQFIPFELGALVGGNSRPTVYHDIPDILEQQPQLHVWQVSGGGANIASGIVSLNVLTDGPVLLAVSNRWGGGGNSSGDWMPELTTQEEFLADGWTEYASPILWYLTDLEILSGIEQTVYVRNSAAGESFTYRTEKYRAPALLTTQFTSAVPEPSAFLLCTLALLAVALFSLQPRVTSFRASCSSFAKSSSDRRPIIRLNRDRSRARIW